ncbi:MAG TPA: hypothetical protein DHW02_11935 [Ktedonobacter sp.]|nr:hypothetical protein [Ktedonobacter sp.]
MFDKLLEEDERVIALMAEREERGRIKGEVRGKAELLTTIIEIRFPTLAEKAHSKLQHVKRLREFDQLARLVVTAPDENALRWVLDIW